MKLKLILLFLLLYLQISPACAEGLRTMFQNNQAVICGINIRNFNSKDLNGNKLIDSDEERGNFLNAIERLDEIKSIGINTLHLLPITPTGRLKALGTAGSLYAISDFESINPQIVDDNSDLSPKEQAKKFIEECHKRGIKVIIDLPSCGSYDMFLTRPELFIKDKKQLSIVPTDWTDVRLFNTGNDENLNQDLTDIHKKFVDMVLDLGADGIRADVATIKPYKFWQEITNYAREKNPEFLFLAEASDSWREPPSKYAEFTPYDKLLEAGFDGYYGSFFGLKDWKSSKDFHEHIKFNKKLSVSYPDKKSVILSFTTHDELSPVLIKGEKFSVMIAWLEATLPFNPYFIDGFQSGDSYIYPWANTKADKTETDDDYYFVHRGKLDIFNFSAKPQGDSVIISDAFKRAMEFRTAYSDLVSNGLYNPVKCEKEKVVAFTRNYKGQTIIVIANLDFKHPQKRITLRVPGVSAPAKLSKKDIPKGSAKGAKIQKTLEVVYGLSNYRTKKNKIMTDLEAGEIKVYKIPDIFL